MKLGRSVTLGRPATIAGLVALTAALVWLLFVALPRWYGNPRSADAPAPAAPAEAGRKIKARLFYVAEGGTKLTSVEQDVPFGEGTLEQGRAIALAQLAPVAEPMVSPIPIGTTLRGLFLTPSGEVFVDLSREGVSARSSGSRGELLEVYAVVNALMANLPAVTSVQLLVDGKEVDTLEGHIDLRRPLIKNLSIVEEAAAPTPSAQAASPTPQTVSPSPKP